MFFSAKLAAPQIKLNIANMHQLEKNHVPAYRCVFSEVRPVIGLVELYSYSVRTSALC